MFAHSLSPLCDIRRYHAVQWPGGSPFKSLSLSFIRLRRKYAFHYEKLCRCELNRKDLGANSDQIHAPMGEKLSFCRSLTLEK